MPRLHPFLAAAVLAGCANPVDETANRLLPDATIADAARDGTPDPAATCLAPGDAYLFDTLRLTSLAGDPAHGAIPQLNHIWAEDIEGRELNVLFEVFEADEARVRIRALNAARLDADPDAICRLPATAIEMDFRREGDRLVMDAPAGLNIYAGSESIPRNCAPDIALPNAIPVREVRLEVRPSPDCGRLVDGRAVQAVIFAEDLRRICTCLAVGRPAEACEPLDPDYTGNGCDGCNPLRRNLESLLTALGGGETGYETDAAGRPFIRLEATFTAERLTVSPPVCAGADH